MTPFKVLGHGKNSKGRTINKELEYLHHGLYKSSLITPATSGILDGTAEVYSPTPGEFLLDAWPVILEGFDGTTPVTDLSLTWDGSGDGGGFYFGSSTGPSLAEADSVEGNGPMSSYFQGMRTWSNGDGPSLRCLYDSGWRAPQFITTDPLLTCITTTGRPTPSGSDTESEVGSFYWVFEIGTPA